MKEYSDSFTLNKNISNIYNLLLEDNKILNSLFNIKKYDKNDWKNNTKIDYLTIEEYDIPDFISHCFLNKTKIINLEIKNIKILFNDNEIIIKSKIKPFNNKSFVIKTTNFLNLFKFKIKYHLKKIDNNNTLIDIHIFVRVLLNNSLKTFIEDYIINYYKILINKTISLLII